MSMSNYTKNAMLNHILTATAYPSPNSSLHLGLFKADPTDDFITANEVDVLADDTAYARQSLAFAESAAPDNGESLNTSAATFAAVVYGTGATAYKVTHIGIFDALTAGNLLYHTPLTAPVTREVSKTLTFDIDTVKVTQDKVVPT